MTMEQTMNQYLAIQRLAHRYADAVVQRDVLRWSSCWAQEAAWDLGNGRAVVGKDAIVALWSGAMGTMTAVVQNVLNGDVWVGSRDESDPQDETGSLHGRWYIVEHYQPASGDRGLLLGHYDDEYVRDGDDWLYSRRRLTVHYAGPPDLSGTFFNSKQTMDERGQSSRQ